MYEVLATAVEAARPKGLKSTTLDVDEALTMSDGQLQSKLLDAGPSHSAIERVFRKLSLRVHPDKNPDDAERAQQAFNRLKEAKDTVIRGHETVKQDDGSVLLTPLAVHAETASAHKAHGKESGLLRFDVGPCASIKAEVMVLVKGPLELAIKTRKDPASKDKDDKDAADESPPGPVSGQASSADTPATPAGAPTADGAEPDFIAAKAFSGSMPGYAFKAGVNGQGYYRDAAAKRQTPGSAPEQ